MAKIKAQSRRQVALSPYVDVMFDTAAQTPTPRGRLLRWYPALCVVVLTAAAMPKAVPSSDIPGIEHRLIGHPKERFPLRIYANSAASSSLNSAIQDAVAQWNQVFEQIFRKVAFTWTDNKTDADILIRFAKDSGIHHEMGETEIDADKRGVIRLPVKINLNPPKPRGRTDVRQVLFDVAAHELGHALPAAYQPSEFDNVL